MWRVAGISGQATHPRQPTVSTQQLLPNSCYPTIAPRYGAGQYA
jgi:hypothetical protein